MLLVVVHLCRFSFAKRAGQILKMMSVVLLHVCCLKKGRGALQFFKERKLST